MGLGALTSYANLLEKQKQNKILDQNRALQQQKLGIPLSQQQTELESTVQALTLFPYMSVAAKKLMMDKRRDPGFNAKWLRELNAYTQHPEGMVGTLEQQMFMGKTTDPTSRDMRRFFGLAGNFYAMAAPALMRQSGSRGQYVLKGLDPHLPDFSRNPDQVWDRLPAVHARLRQSYDMMTSHPLYKPWVDQTKAAAMKALPEYRKMFDNKEWKSYSPGIFGKDAGKLPRGVVAGNDNGKVKYFDLDSGKEFTPPTEAAPALPPSPFGKRPLPLLKSHYDPTAGPPNVAEIPSKEAPIGRVEP